MTRGNELQKRRNFSPWAYWQLRLVDAATARRTSAGQGDTSRMSRSDLQALLGAEPSLVPLDLEVTESVECERYRRDRVVFDVEAAMSVPAYLLVPHERTVPGPAVLAIHGHGAGKSMVCDIDDGDPARRAEIISGGGAYAHELACRGFVVFAPDLRCFGERQDPQWDPAGHKYDCDWNLVCAVMAGVNPIAQNLWDLKRCLEVLGAQPLVDDRRLGVAGLSYGATMSLLLAAMDDRVRAVVVSGFLSSWEAAHRVPWNMCGSQVMWNQIGLVEHIDLAALVAPRPMLIETGIHDPIFPVGPARATVARLRDIYSDLGHDSDLEHDVFDGEHRWNGTRAYEFLQSQLA